MSIRKLWYIVTLLAFVMLPLAGCGGGGSKSVTTTDKGTQLTVNGSVPKSVSKSTPKTVALTPIAINTVAVYNALDGATLGTATVGADGKFSGLTFTLATAKTILVFKATVAAGTFTSVVPIDLSNPPAAGVITGNNQLTIVISQDTTNIATVVSSLLGLTGQLGDAGMTLNSVSKTYTDAAQLVVANGGQQLAYSGSGLALTGKLDNAVLLPARDATTFSFDDLKNISLDGKIISAFIPGNKPIVNFQIVDKASGKGISGMRVFSLHIAQLKEETTGSNSYWMNYISNGMPLTAVPAFTERGASVQTAPVNPSADAVTVFNTTGTVKAQGYTIIDHGDGSYTATFGADIKTNTNVVYDATLTHRIAIGARNVSVPGVVGKTPGAYAGPISPVSGAVFGQFPNTNGTAFVYDFKPSTGLGLTDASGNQAFARDIVTIAACNQCHYKIEFGSNNTSGHFGSRPDTKICVVCHTPQLGVNGAGDFTPFIHQIHMGAELPAATTLPGIDASGFKFSMDIRNCTVCHKGVDVNNWKTKPSRKSCGSCHNALAFTAHYGDQSGSDQLCAGCHAGTTAIKETAAVHISNNKTANNTTIPTTLADIQYTINSATINSTTRYPLVSFTIKKNGANAVLDTPGANSARRLPMGAQGFKGGPTIGVAFGVPQDGITSPNDYNFTNPAIRVSLTDLWRGTGGSLAANADGSYTATITTAVPASAKVITAAMYGSFTQAVPFYAYSTGVTVENTTGIPRLAASKLLPFTGSAARRPIVSTALCNKCHDQLGTMPNFHSGERTDAPLCALCHNTARSSGSWNSGSSNFVHAIHGAGKRSVPFKWHASSTYQLWTVGYPGILRNCEQCHLAGTYDFSASASAAQVSNLFYQTVATGTPSTPTAPAELPPWVTAGKFYGNAFSYNVSTGVTVQAGSSSLVNSPISSACFSCHDTAAAKAHMEANGGALYKPRSAVFINLSTASGRAWGGPQVVEQCLVCHGGVSSTNSFNTTAPNIKAVHRWW